MTDRLALNLAWVLLAGFLVFFMQAGFALVETGMVRAKNAAHTMAMNVVVYALGIAGFWAAGFAIMYGGHALPESLGGGSVPGRDVAGLFGTGGFFLAGTPSPGVFALFLFQLMFMDTAATIPTGALAERWKFSSFVLYGLFVSTLLYPVYGHWVWGGGWLARLGADLGLGHGHVDFAGSSVVHMVGGFTALAGAWRLGPRLGKFRPDGRPNPLPAHNVPMYMLGTLVLVFGWFGFNAGSTLAATDPIVARVAVNTVLASAAGGLAALFSLWRRFGKPDPSFLCNGILAGLVSVTASCAYVAPWAAVLVGGVGGLLAVWGAFFVERWLRVDDPVGAVSVHGLAGLWGTQAVGLFADGTYAPAANFNGVPGNVTGLFYGGAAQLAAQAVGVVVNLLWVLPVASGWFWLVGRLVGNRPSAQAEFVGLDVPELGALGYITQDPQVKEGRVITSLPAEPRAAAAPPDRQKRFAVLVEGVEAGQLAQVWSDLCQAGAAPPPAEFRAVYPYMTTLQGTRFRFRGGDPLMVRANLERLLKDRLPGLSVRVRLEG
jgi:Amt family ammonium transporter